MKRSRLNIACAGACLLLAGTTAVAQVRHTPPVLTPVDPRHDDVSSLTTSLRVLPPDLRQPIGFERVYKVEGTPRLYGHAPEGEGLMARVSGAVVAVFPRSEYSSATGRPQIPAGTVFLLGEASEVLAPAREASRPRPAGAMRPNAARVDGRVSMQATPERASEPRTRPARSARVDRSIWTDEGFRRERVLTLMDAM